MPPRGSSAKRFLLPAAAVLVVIAVLAVLIAVGRGGSNPLNPGVSLPKPSAAPSPTRVVPSTAPSATVKPAAPSAAGSAPASPAASCPPIVALGFRGSGEAQVSDPPSNGWTGPVLTAIVQRARQLKYADGGSFAAVPLQGVDYQAIAPTNLLTFTVGLSGSVQDGVTKGLAAAAQAVAGCQGKTHLVLLGYSQGAIVARDVAQQAPAGTVGAVFLLGDPDQEPNANGVQGGGAAGQGIVRALFGTSTDAYYSLPIVRFSYCHTGDPICQFTPAGLADPAGGTAHASYGSDPAELTTLAEILTNVARSAAGLPAAQPVSP